ncbi:MAG TPA: biotin--[acetyl-CoA-carboxylase] ligase [Blastocatellia bacterium]|nr:biotin--[acetyl-CoA-carboxylase] ligase [Blastocatellia bacterium]
MTKLGATILRYESLPSTNDLAKEMAAAGAGEGVAIVAAAQTAGRGRQGRSWASPPGAGLYLSIILKPRIKPADSPVLTLAAAVAVAETFALDFGLRADIKWPNDLLVGGRKICGILVESAIEGSHLQYAVMGIGVNLGQREFPGELRRSATSVLLETGQVVSADDFLKPLLPHLDRWYRIAMSRPGEVISRWEELSSYARGCAVRVTAPEGIIEGITRGLTPSGALRLELAGGETREILSGEVTLRKAET